jgi:hypothetical protein
MNSEITCSSCDTRRESPLAKNGQPRIPRAWKLIAGKIYCPKCKLSHYALRAVCLPIARCDWKVIMPLLRQSWRESMRCANWLLTQFYQRDVIAADRSPKLPPWKAPYLYNDARAMFPDIVPTTIVSLINTVQAKYRSARFDLWRAASSLPTYRRLPLPINAQTWELQHEENDWRFNFRMAGEWRQLTLRSDRQFHRQHHALAQMLAGEVEPGEAALYEQGEKLMLKIPGWFPRQAPRAGDRTVKASTCEDGFLIAVDGEAVWKLNADHVKRWIVGGQRQQQRLSEDLKAERRFPVAMRQGITDRMRELADRRHNRMQSWMHEASMQLVNWTARRHASSLLWDPSPASMLPAFPWFEFAQRLEQKCALAGIGFTIAEVAANVAEDSGGR